MKIKNIQLQYEENDNDYHQDNGIRFSQDGLLHRNNNEPARKDIDSYVIFYKFGKPHTNNKENHYWANDINNIKECAYTYYGRYYYTDNNVYKQLELLKLI